SGECCYAKRQKKMNRKRVERGAQQHDSQPLEGLAEGGDRQSYQGVDAPEDCPGFFSANQRPQGQQRSGRAKKTRERAVNLNSPEVGGKVLHEKGRRDVIDAEDFGVEQARQEKLEIANSGNGRAAAHAILERVDD